MEYVVATRELAPQGVFSIRDRVPATEIPAFLAGAFRDLFDRLGLLGVQPTGHPFVIYHAFGAEIDAEVCVPIPEGASANGRIQSREVPPATVARTLHVGPYEELGAAYRALTDWIDQRGLETAGPVRERYLNGPGDATTASEYRTEVEIPVTPAKVAVPA